MRMSEIRPCDGCLGPLLNAGVGNFYVVRSSAAFPNQRAIRQVEGINLIFGGKSRALAEVFTPDADVVKVVGEMDPTLYDNLLLCFECHYKKSLAEILEGVRSRRNKIIPDEPTP